MGRYLSASAARAEAVNSISKSPQTSEAGFIFIWVKRDTARRSTHIQFQSAVGRTFSNPTNPPNYNWPTASASVRGEKPKAGPAIHTPRHPGRFPFHREMKNPKLQTAGQFRCEAVRSQHS